MSIYRILAALNAAIRAAAQSIGGKDFSRKSALTAEKVISVLVNSEGGCLAKILHDAGIPVTASAFSQRRAQIPPKVFRSVFDNFNSACTDGDLFRGYKLVAADGTVVCLPHNPAASSFVQNDGIPKGVNQLHVTPLYNILSRTFDDLVIQSEPKKDEIGALVDMLERNTFTQKTLLLCDRGFEGYNLIAHCLEKQNLDFLIRVKQNKSAMREVAKLPMMELDCTIGFTIHLCWGVETAFRDWKYTLGLVNLHGKSDAFAEQEIYASLTAFNFASRVCREVVIRQPKDGVYAYKVNFKMAVMLCKEFLRTHNADGEKLLAEIARYTVPIHPDRQDERNLKTKGFVGFVYRVAA